MGYNILSVWTANKFKRRLATSCCYIYIYMGLFLCIDYSNSGLLMESWLYTVTEEITI